MKEGVREVGTHKRGEGLPLPAYYLTPFVRHARIILFLFGILLQGVSYEKAQGILQGMEAGKEAGNLQRGR